MPKGFAASTAAAAGMTKQAINRHLARAEALGDDLPRVTGTSLDKSDAVDALSFDAIAPRPAPAAKARDSSTA